MMEYWNDGRMKDNLEDRIPKTGEHQTKGIMEEWEDKKEYRRQNPEASRKTKKEGTKQEDLQRTDNG
jgi:hypothetical protein